MDTLINLAYIVASVLFILGIKLLGHPDSARKGNQLSSMGMLVAVLVTLLDQNILSYQWIIVGLVIGSAIGLIAAKRVQMTGMPELVAIFNGFGGLASLLVGWAEFQRLYATGAAISTFSAGAIFLAVFIGGITFTGSVYAWGKLSGKLGGNALTFSGQLAFNALIALLIVATGIALAAQPSADHAYTLLYAGIGLALLLGIFGVMPIGGGDMPVVISLLNSLSGLAAAAAGFVILNNVLIVAGCLVGCSGLLLTTIMCKAMNRTLSGVLFSGFGSSSTSSADVEGEMVAATPEDAYYVLEAAETVVIIPGYGMAVAQAQHVVKELGEVLEANGTEVIYAIHPVAGRMPGHMNALLAEADVPYEQLIEMETVNPRMDTVDVAIVIGANDVVNPAAIEDEGCAIYGMPIIEAHRAKTIYSLKRGKGAGFSGLVNKLYFSEKNRMLYGDAKATVTELTAQFSSN